MNNELSMDYYLGGIAYIILYAIIAYPFLSFILKKISANKWFGRICFILLLLAVGGKSRLNFNDYVSATLLISLFISFILYHLITDRLNGVKKVWRAVIETVLTSGLLIATSSIVALVGNIRLGKLIIERFPDGSYSFEPGYIDVVLKASVLCSILLIASKYFYIFQQEKAESRKQRKIKEASLEKELIHAQLEALHAKVNPHFLYNSLNTIAGLALVDGEKTRQMALSLSRFFRYSINKEQSNLTSVAEELEMINTYLEIEKIRFGNQLDYTIACAPECEKELIPRTLLQPLVENCIKHGWSEELGTIRIQINIKKENDRLIISIKDSGAPFTPGFIPGYGLQSTYDKLELLFPNRHDLSIISDPEKEVRITIRETASSIS